MTTIIIAIIMRCDVAMGTRRSKLSYHNHYFLYWKQPAGARDSKFCSNGMTSDSTDFRTPDCVDAPPRRLKILA